MVATRKSTQKIFDYAMQVRKTFHHDGVEGASVETILESEFFIEHKEKLMDLRFPTLNIPLSVLMRYSNEVGKFQPYAVELMTSVETLIESIDTCFKDAA